MSSLLVVSLFLGEKYLVVDDFEIIFSLVPFIYYTLFNVMRTKKKIYRTKLTRQRK